jgi:hypothetical protein
MYINVVACIYKPEVAVSTKAELLAASVIVQVPAVPFARQYVI